MKKRTANTALLILFSGAAIVSPALAQDATQSKPVAGANLQYVGADTRIGIGVDSDTKVRGELYHVITSSDTSATIGELWAGRHAGGLKLSHQWMSAPGADTVHKVFGAVDQGANSVRKASVGYGQEYEKWFWNTYLSKGLTGARLSSVNSISNTTVVTGSDAGGAFEQDLTTTTTSRWFEKPYDWGLGLRAGHFYEAALLRMTAGVDYEWGKYSSKQWTLSVLAEKYFPGSAFSLALGGELNRKSGDFVTDKSDHRGYVMVRYDLGGPASSYRSTQIARNVTTTEKRADPNWVAPPVAPAVASAPAAAAAPATITRMDTRQVRSDKKDEQESYFDLGSSRLKPAAQKELDALVARIKGQAPYVSLKVDVIGHTCPTGSDRNNIPLSKKRAEVVKAYLVGQGVDSNLITTDGVGGRSPKYPEVKGQSFRNRRADTLVTVVKEQSEQYPVTVAAPPAPPPPPVAPPPPATAPIIDVPVTREVFEPVNNWQARALRNTPAHKTSVDTYTWRENSTEESYGPKRYLNRGPVAANDQYNITCSGVSTFSVLANDSDPDGDTLSITSVGTGAYGSVSIAGGAIVYTPNAASCAGVTDTFTYTISDGKGGTDTATVTVVIASNANNRAPVAQNDTYVVACRAGRELDVLVNDSDPDGDTLTITSITQPSYAAISINANGRSLQYQPGINCFLRDTFTYTISDGRGGSSTATVTLIDP